MNRRTLLSRFCGLLPLSFFLSAASAAPAGDRTSTIGRPQEPAGGPWELVELSDAEAAAAWRWWTTPLGYVSSTGWGGLEFEVIRRGLAATAKVSGMVPGPEEWYASFEYAPLRIHPIDVCWNATGDVIVFDFWREITSPGPEVVPYDARLYDFSSPPCAYKFGDGDCAAVEFIPERESLIARTEGRG